MKRKPSHEQFSQQMALKQPIKKSHSPINIKKKPKFENEVLSFLGPQKSKITKQKQDNKKSQPKIDSNNSTANCTISRSRLPKGKSKRQKEDKVKKHQSLSDNHIMQIINSFATKIQRQWRVFLMRRRFKGLINSLKKQYKSYEQNSHQIPSLSSYQKLKFDENKIKHLSYLTDNGEEIVSSYNLQKYEPYPQQFVNKQPHSYRSSANSQGNSMKIQRQLNQFQQEALSCEKKPNYSEDINQRAKQGKFSEKVPALSKIPSIEAKIQQKEDRRTSYDVQPSKRSNLQNRRHSTGDLLKDVKSFQIDKAFQIKIAQEYPKINSIKTVKKIQANSPIKRGEQIQGINIKYPFDAQLKYKRKQIQQYKKKKLLSIQGRFKREEVTQRSYLQIIRKINEQHQNKVEYFKLREGQIRSNWYKLININRQQKTKPSKIQPKYLQDENEHIQNSISNIDVSVSFDKWDFNSSAKKSIDNLQIDLHHSKNYSLESVLRYLEDQDTEKQIQQRKFKKNKSKQVIEAIAQRSKEISDKSFQQCIAQSKQIKVQSLLREQQKQKINIPMSKEVEGSPDKNIVIQQENPCKQSEQAPNNSFQLQIQQVKVIESISHKKAQAKSQSQSLLISQIQAASPGEYLFSDKEIVQSQQKTILKDLLFKDFSSQEKDSNSNNKNNKHDKNSAINKFVNIVNQKLLLSNIKVINSIKFICAKIGEEKIKKKSKNLIKYPKIECDINAINTWLLQISHFILDNYQTLIRDNLVLVRQPPGQQLLTLAHKNLPYVNVYQTIPEYVFKDFQFHYIKTIAINNGVGAEIYDLFSTLLYTFHRALVDSLNLSLTDQLITGRNWLQVPWFNQFKQKKRILNDYAKISLQKSINVVSNWGQYGLGRLEFQDEIAKIESKEYQQQKINLVCREEAINLPLNQILTQSNMLLKIASQIVEYQLTLLARQMFDLYQY